MWCWLLILPYPVTPHIRLALPWTALQLMCFQLTCWLWVLVNTMCHCLCADWLSFWQVVGSLLHSSGDPLSQEALFFLLRCVPFCGWLGGFLSPLLFLTQCHFSRQTSWMILSFSLGFSCRFSFCFMGKFSAFFLMFFWIFYLNVTLPIFKSSSSSPFHKAVYSVD